MKCPKCQFENPDGMQFCGKCASKLELICPNCNFSNPPDFIFCGKCAQNLQEPKEAPPIDYSEPQSYTPEHLKDKILTTRSSIEGERKLVTVFFADVVNYTAMSEKLDPEEVHQIMDGCFKILLDEIHKYEGTINQFTGDGIMALFGAPVAHEDHAQRACYAALAVQKAMGEYGEKIKKDTGLDFQIRIGLNSGPVIVGSIGDDLRMDYTAVGDTTNLAARIETEADSGTILVSENTHKIARSYFEFVSIGKLEVKGKEKPQEAYKIIKAGEVETRIGASIAKGLTKFVGRRNSMAALMEPFEKVQEGSGQVVGIVGEAGVGKSRLLLEFINRLPQGEFTYLLGRCLQYGENIIYRPIIDIVKSYLEIKEGDREFVIKKKIRDKTFELDREFSESSLPVFQDFLSSKVDDEDYKKLEPQQKREKTFESIKDLFIRESNKKPLIIVIEDLHWIDKTSEEFIDYLIDWIAKAPILLILLYRTEYRHQWGSKTYYNRIGLDHLRTESSTELVKAMLEGGEVAPELRELILNRSAGNPLFMEEFTQTLLENGSIERRDNQFVLSRDISDIQVPDTIQGIIAARMDRLEDNLKRTMQVASVIGREFAYRILQIITDMKEKLQSYLLNLQGLEFIYETKLSPELEYIFKHALTQEVAYNSLLLNRRKEIHEKIGEAYEAIYSERLDEFYEILANHYSKSENFEKAYLYFKRSGEKAARNYSNSEAFRFLKEALQALKKLPNTDENKKEQVELIILLGPAMAFLSFPEDSLDILQEGERLAKEIGDEKSLPYFLSAIGMYYTFKGEPFFAVEYGEKSFMEAEKILDLDLMVSPAVSLMVAYTTMGHPLKVVNTASKVIKLIEAAKREYDYFSLTQLPYSFFCGYCGYSLGLLGNFNEGQIFLEKGLSVAIKTGDLITLGLIEIQYGFYWFFKGYGRDTVEHFQRSLKYFEEAEFPLLLGVARTGLGAGYYLLGDSETAKKHAEKGLNIQTESGAATFLALPYYLSTWIHYDSDDFEKARSYAEKALELSRENGEQLEEAISSIFLGLILWRMESKKTDRAEDLILQGMKILEERGVRPFVVILYVFIGEFYIDIGQKEKALEYFTKAESMVKEMKMDYWLKRTQKALDKL
jgi:class 3 adenylate cyclase/tetratricopeptide (TPR) repeat protein